MRKPNFGVVTGVVVTLAIFGFASKVASRFLPLPEPNRMEKESADFLRQGMRHAIDWLPLSSQSLALAKGAKKPILLVMGTSWCLQARLADNQVFSDIEVQALLRKDFTCIRVDLIENPELVGSLLPLSRGAQDPNTGGSSDFDPAFQVWVMNSEAKLFGYAYGGIQDGIDSSRFISELMNFRRQMSTQSSLPAPGLRQAEEVEKLRTATPEGRPDFARFSAAIAASVDPVFGGFPLGSGVQILRPQAYRYILASGDEGLFRRALDPILRSNAVDWLDGGFFRIAPDRAWSETGYDKSAVQNAEMAAVLAGAADRFREPVYKRVAEMTFDSLLHEYLTGGLPATGRVGDEIAEGRSRRSSFSISTVRRLWGDATLEDEEVEWARSNLGLEPLSSRRMTIRLNDPRTALDPRFDRIVGKLKASKSLEPVKYSGRGSCEQTGLIVARMIETARALRDSKRLGQALALLPRVELFRRGSSVRHSNRKEASESTYLGDYLAYCDARFEALLATSNRQHLDKLLPVFTRARTLFRLGENPVWRTSRAPLLPDSDAPEILDNLNESCAARQIRLLALCGAGLQDAVMIGEARAAAGHVMHWGPALAVPIAGCMAATTLLGWPESNRP